MSELVFVDTDVFVYARDAGDPNKQRLASAWLESLWRAQLGRTSTQVLSEYYVTVTLKLDPGMDADEAWEDVRALLAWRPQAIDAELIQRGHEVERKDGLGWWDSLIVAAAQLQDCRVLLSEDLQDAGSYGAVTVRSPFTLEVNETMASYAVALLASRAHPPRGRPPGVEAGLAV